MLRRILILTLASIALIQAGCAAGFRAGGPNAGVDAEASIGRRTPVIVQPVP